MHENYTLQNKAAEVAKTVPREWGEFVKALAAFVEVHRNNLVNSPLPELPVNQGRAHMGTTLVLLLADCVADVEKRKALQRP